MNSGDDNHGRGHPGPAGPRPAGVLARAWFWISWPFVWLWRSCRDGWLMAKGERKARRWWRPQVWPVTALYLVLSVAYIGLIVLSLVPGTPSDWLWDPSTESKWRNMLTAFGLSSTTVVAAAWFLLWRFWRARRYYLRRARRHADEMVRPGTIIGEVVGRDPLCDALMDDLRDRKRRRPHVIVGAIGVGKSALLVRLTQKLAEKGVAPVVVRLRDVRGELDFARLAEDTFLAEILVKVSSRSEAEKVWHRLRRQSDRVVVLADGLEDALKDAPDRENVIREAIGKAGKDGLPLVVTSRPEKSLESIDAAQTHLGPLSEEAALHYVAEATNWRSDRQRMSWVVEAAEIAESPLYLNIAKDLERRGLLEPVVGGGGEDEYSDPRDHDAWVLRYDMLDAWVQALVDGHLYPEQPLSRAGRRRVVDCLSALACAALRTNSTYVAYDALTRTSRDDEKNRVVDALLGYLAGPSGPSGPAGAGRAARPAGRAVASRADASGQGARTNPAGHIDVRLAGSWGSRLGLVEVQDQGVRFHHSVLQAYLASRCMGALMPVRTAAVSVPRPVGMAAVSRYAGGPVEELLILSSATETEDVTDAYFTPALRRPGRELAMSMVFYSRSRGALEGCHGREADRAASGADCEREHRCPISIVRDLLLDAARQAVDEISRPSDGARAREATWSRTPRSGRWSCTPPPWTSTASTTSRCTTASSRRSSRTGSRCRPTTT